MLNSGRLDNLSSLFSSHNYHPLYMYHHSDILSDKQGTGKQHQMLKQRESVQKNVVLLCPNINVDYILYVYIHTYICMFIWSSFCCLTTKAVTQRKHNHSEMCFPSTNSALLPQGKRRRTTTKKDERKSILFLLFSFQGRRNSILVALNTRSTYFARQCHKCDCKLLVVGHCFT